MNCVQLELATIKRDWIDAVLPEVRRVIADGKEFTSDDLHARIATPPDSPNWWGVLLAKLANEQAIERVGARASSRPVANGRLVSVWRKTANSD